MSKFWALIVFAVGFAPLRFALGSTGNNDAGPDTCGKDRRLLSRWFMQHGEPELLEEPIPGLVQLTDPNPYDDPSNPPGEVIGFCAMRWSGENVGKKRYTLANFRTEKGAKEAGFAVTHRGHCGSCSSLQDLGVYMGGNLTGVVRTCGFKGFFSDTWMSRCLGELGFSPNCIPIWKFNIANTRRTCLSACVWSWITNEPYNKADGSLNDCLQCDEDNSGPNFKYFAGRTRRDSGIRSAIRRPPQSIYNMSHCYWYGNLLP